MNFFKKLFSAKSEKNQNETDQETPFKEIVSTEYFDERYDEDFIKPEMLEGCLKMIEGFAVANKLDRKVESPINHPLNLDQVVEDGFGFELYCKALNLGNTDAAMMLAYAFSDFLIKLYGFKLFHDKKPEYPLRGMTLKYDREGVLLSLYPFEYAVKVLNYEARFEDLVIRLESNLKSLPGVDDVLKQFLNPNKG
ncbi:hypothetical protein OC25_20415 [Pedobacter kyungheensis]|uniref:Uncharacterized protein n=1 Tax=Pedobacter kyungheensis TaxID=1069985 RepID=A0A0C1DCP0_9SPHI|nr:hypothetical protein [Pedobacter kyungheensis]KIA91720.1 hypothetical protein OC25_20415 [Pedobacter kyungheensis]